MSTLKVDAITNTSDETRYQPTTATAQATTSGTAIDFTGIPSWVKRVAVVFKGVSVSGNDQVLVQLGTSGGFVTTGYAATAGYFSASVQNDVANTTGFPGAWNNAGGLFTGTMSLVNIDGTEWVGSLSGKVDTDWVLTGGGEVDISDTLTQLRVTRSGSNTFDAGQVNIIYE